MNILGNNTSKLNAIIFENRNKNYGAYEIRESYNDSLKKSLLCLGSIVGLLFGSVFIYNRINALPAGEDILSFNDPILNPTQYVVTPIDVTPQTENNASAAPKAGIPTQIIDNAITTVTTNINNPLSGVGSQTATGTSPLSVVEGTFTIATSTPSVAVLAPPVETLVLVDDMPDFEGGMAGVISYVGKNIVYPDLAMEAGKQGTVYISFVVSETGIVESAKVLRGIGLGCDEEVLRVINKMPRWKKVGRNQGHPVKVRFNIPVVFKLK